MLQNESLNVMYFVSVDFDRYFRHLSVCPIIFCIYICMLFVILESLELLITFDLLQVLEKVNFCVIQETSSNNCFRFSKMCHQII